MGAEVAYAEWVAVYWGTRNLRVWAMRHDGTIRAEARSDDGMAGLAPAEFEPALLKLIAPWLGASTMPIIACGMVGARQGWAEAPYIAVPTPPTGGTCKAKARDKRLNLHILPGLKQVKLPDVMRGEETQIAGFLALKPDFDGVLCLPGTHSKWARISAGEVVSFKTFMTGELFGLLAELSVLRHSVKAEGLDADAFDQAVSDTLSRPETMAAKLFQIRAADLLTRASPDIARGRLSGLLIGAELAAAKPYWLGQDVALIGAPKLTALYATALSQQGIAAQEYAGDNMTVKGLSAAYSLTFENQTS